MTDLPVGEAAADEVTRLANERQRAYLKTCTIRANAASARRGVGFERAAQLTHGLRDDPGDVALGSPYP